MTRNCLIEDSSTVSQKTTVYFCTLAGGTELGTPRKPFLRDVAPIFDLPLNILTPVLEVSTVKRMNFIC